MLTVLLLLTGLNRVISLQKVKKKFDYVVVLLLLIYQSTQAHKLPILEYVQNFDVTVPRYNGIIDCIKKIVKTEGIQGLYRGLLANYVKTFPTFAIQFYTLDKMKNLLKNET